MSNFLNHLISGGARTFQKTVSSSSQECRSREHRYGGTEEMESNSVAPLRCCETIRASRHPFPYFSVTNSSSSSLPSHLLPFLLLPSPSLPSHPLPAPLCSFFPSPFLLCSPLHFPLLHSPLISLFLSSFFSSFPSPHLLSSTLLCPPLLSPLIQSFSFSLFSTPLPLHPLLLLSSPLLTKFRRPQKVFHTL